MVAKQIDYSVYLVTGRELLPQGIDYYDSLERSVRDGGVTIVQLREKKVETSEFLEIAKKSLEICDKVSNTYCSDVSTMYLCLSLIHI